MHPAADALLDVCCQRGLVFGGLVFGNFGLQGADFRLEFFHLRRLILFCGLLVFFQRIFRMIQGKTGAIVIFALCQFLGER